MKKTRPYAIVKAVQKGFTLIEMMIVGVIISIVLLVLAPQFFGSADSAKATAMMKAADGAFRQLQALNVTCGTPTSITSNPLPGTGFTISDVFFQGSSAVATAYTNTSNCYAKASIKPMVDLGQTTATAGAYTVQNFPIAFTNGGTAPLKVAFSNVPDSVVLELASRYNPTLATLATSDTNSTVVQYSTATGGLRTLTILKQ